MTEHIERAPIVKGFLIAIFILCNTAFACMAQVLSGVYWDPANGGNGFAIEQQGNQLFLAWYAYTTGGAPYWLIALIPIVTSPTLTLPVIATGPLSQATDVGGGVRAQV